MRLETILDLQGGQVVLFGDFSATVEIYRRICANGGVMNTWIGTWTDPNGVRVDLFDDVRTLRKAIEEGIFHVMSLWQQHVVDNGTEEDLNTLIKFDQNVSRVLGLSDHAVAMLHQQIQKRLRKPANPIDVTVSC